MGITARAVGFSALPLPGRGLPSRACDVRVIRAFSGTMRRIGMTLSLTALLLVQFLFSSSSSSAIRLLPSQIRADGFPVLGSS